MKFFSMGKERIIQFIEYKGLSKNKFYIETGISNGTLDKKTGISTDTIEKLYSSFPEINLEWLLTGKGEMIKQDRPAAVPDNEELSRLKEENSRLKDKVIALLEENTRLKDEAASKSNKHTTARPAPGKLTGR